MSLQIGDRVGITNPKSVAHFRRVMPGTIEAVEAFNGQAPVYGRRVVSEETGQPLPAYMIRFADGTDYIGAYAASELTEVSEAEFERLQHVPDPFAHE